MIGECGAVDSGSVGDQLLLGCCQSRLRRFQRIARVLQLFARNGTGTSQTLTSRQILLSGRQVGLANLHSGLELRGGREQVADFPHGLRELRFRLVQSHLGVLLVQLHQRLSGLHELRVVSAYRDHGSGHLRCDLHDVAAYVRIVG